MFGENRIIYKTRAGWTALACFATRKDCRNWNTKQACCHKSARKPLIHRHHRNEIRDWYHIFRTRAPTLIATKTYFLVQAMMLAILYWCSVCVFSAHKNYLYALRDIFFEQCTHSLFGTRYFSCCVLLCESRCQSLHHPISVVRLYHEEAVLSSIICEFSWHPNLNVV